MTESEKQAQFANEQGEALTTTAVSEAAQQRDFGRKQNKSKSRRNRRSHRKTEHNDSMRREPRIYQEADLRTDFHFKAYADSIYAFLGSTSDEGVSIPMDEDGNVLLATQAADKATEILKPAPDRRIVVDPDTRKALQTFAACLVNPFWMVRRRVDADIYSASRTPGNGRKISGLMLLHALGLADVTITVAEKLGADDNGNIIVKLSEKPIFPLPPLDWRIKGMAIERLMATPAGKVLTEGGSEIDVRPLRRLVYGLKAAGLKTEPLATGGERFIAELERGDVEQFGLVLAYTAMKDHTHIFNIPSHGVLD